MTVADKVTAILAEQALLKPGDVRPEDTLETLGLDSMAVVEVIFAIEEAFDISVPFNANAPQDSPFDITSVATITRAVEQLVAAREA